MGKSINKPPKLAHNRKKNRKSSDVDYSKLLTPLTREGFIQRIKSKPPALGTSYSINGEPLRLQTGALSVVAAPTGHGKTTFLLNLLLDAARKYSNCRHWFFSYEESPDLVTLKGLNIFCGEEYSLNNLRTIRSYYPNDSFESFQDQKNFEANEKEFWALVEAGTINIIGTSEWKSDDLVQAIMKVAENDAGLIAIDYLQLIKPTSNRFIQRYDELKQICHDLVTVAIETGLPIVGAAQFNRNVTSTNKLIPQKLADASDIEKSANKVIGLWNGNKTDEEGLVVKPNCMYIKVLKARDEKSGIYDWLPWDGNTGVIGFQSSSNTDKSYSSTYSKPSATEKAWHVSNN